MTRKNNLSARWLRVLIAMAMLVSLAVMTMPGSAEDVGVTVVDDAAILWPTWQDPAYLPQEDGLELDVTLAVQTSTGGYALAAITLTMEVLELDKAGVVAGNWTPDTWTLTGIDAETDGAEGWYSITISAKHPSDHLVWQVTEVFTNAVCVDTGDDLGVDIDSVPDYVNSDWTFTGEAYNDGGCAGVDQVQVSLERNDGRFWASGTWVLTGTALWNPAAYDADDEEWWFDLGAVTVSEAYTYTICPRVLDKAGNILDPENCEVFRIDDTPPDVAITTEVDRIVCEYPSVISGTITDTLSGWQYLNYALRNVTTNRWWNGSAFVYSATPIITNTNGVTIVDDVFWSVDLPELNAAREYEFWVMGADVAGNESDLVGPLSFFYAQCADIGLWNGWNLVSLPLIPTPEDPNEPDAPNLEYLLGDMIDDIFQVRTWFWEEGVLTPRSWVNGGVADLYHMVDGQGYWWDVDPGVGAALKGPEPFWWLTIQGLELPLPPAVPPTYAVYQGWNLIGFKCLESAWAAGYLGDVSQTVQAMYGWDADTGSYFLVWGDDLLDPGLGYWLAVSQNGTIYPACYVDLK